MFAQDVFTAIPERLRISGALRYNVASYKSRAANAPIGSSGRPLFPDDSARFSAFSGRIGAVLNVGGGFDIAVKYARGFRAPNTTDLGIIGLVGTGFEVDAGPRRQPAAASSARRPAATLYQRAFRSRGLGRRQPTALISACATVSKRGSFEVTGFTSKLKDVYFDQALVLAAGRGRNSSSAANKSLRRTRTDWCLSPPPPVRCWCASTLTTRVSTESNSTPRRC